MYTCATASLSRALRRVKQIKNGDYEQNTILCLNKLDSKTSLTIHREHKAAAGVLAVLGLRLLHYLGGVRGEKDSFVPMRLHLYTRHDIVVA